MTKPCLKIKVTDQKPDRLPGILIIAFLFVFISVPVSLHAQNFNKTIYGAYITGDMDTWEQSLRNVDPSSLSVKEKYDFAMAHYGFIGYCLGRDFKSRARPYLDKVQAITDELLEIEPDNPGFIALRGAIYGFTMSYQPQKMLFIGPKALKLVNLAMEKGRDCPQAWVEAGNTDWWMPEIFGGSRVKALADYEKAIQLMEKDPPAIQNNWYYLNTNMILASWYEERGRTFAAREIYRKMIQHEPRFTWAREKLNK